MTDYNSMSDDQLLALYQQEKAKAAPTTDAGGMEMLGDGYRRNTIGQTFRAGPRGGFQQVGGPTMTMANDARGQAQGLNTALAGIDRVDRQLKNTKDIGPLGFLTNSSDISVLTQSVKDLQLRLKEQPYNLGVLNGPDLDLLESIVADPSQLKSAVFRQSIGPRLANLSSIIGDQYRSGADSFKGIGGRTEVLPPLYRSPTSKFTPEEFGRDGRVTPEAMARKPGAAPSRPVSPALASRTPAARDAYKARVLAGTIDPKAPMGSKAHPYIARDAAQADQLPKGTHVMMPDGAIGIVE